MAATLEQFADGCRAALRSGKPLQQALDMIAADLRPLLTNKAFVAATFSNDDPPGKKVLVHDPDLDFYIMAHVQEAGKGGMPHSHGASWAIYGNSTGVTEMTEWRRVNPETEEHVVVEQSDFYALGPGDSKAYGPGVIHSTRHPDKAWVVRITGTDLDKIQRYQFRKSRGDRILEKA